MIQPAAVYGSLSVGDFMLIHAYILALYGPMIWMGSMWGDVVAALTNMEDVMQVFAGNSPPSERNRTGDVQAAGPSHRDGDETFDVVYENVSYHYPKVDMDAEAMGGIYNVTLRLRRGSTVALVGPSGSGKVSCFLSNVQFSIRNRPNRPLCRAGRALITNTCNLVP